MHIDDADSVFVILRMSSTSSESYDFSAIQQRISSAWIMEIRFILIMIRDLIIHTCL